jgi:hypothetical protein
MADLTSGYSHFERPADTDWSEHGAVGDRSDGRRFKKVQQVPNKVMVDKTDANNVYIGETKAGVATSEAYWRIKLITTSGTIITFGFADGSDSFDKEWDERGNYTYS